MGAKNQDTFFTLRVDDHNAVFGVLDGHGAENGTRVAQAAAEAIKAHVAAHLLWGHYDVHLWFGV